MRSSVAFASLIALAASAPLNLRTLPVNGVPAVPDLGLPSVPEVPDVPAGLPVKRDGLGVSALPGAEVPEEVKELLAGVDLRVKRDGLGVPKVPAARLADAENLVGGVHLSIKREVVPGIKLPSGTKLPEIGVPKPPVKRATVGANNIANVNVNGGEHLDNTKVDATTKRANVAADKLADVKVNGVESLDNTQVDAATKRAEVKADEIANAGVNTLDNTNVNVATKRTVDTDVSAKIEEAIKKLSTLVPEAPAAELPNAPEAAAPVKRVNVGANIADLGVDTKSDAADAQLDARQFPTLDLDIIDQVIAMLADIIS